MPKPINNNKYRLFFFLTLAFPLLFFVTVELGLRVFGSGQNVDLFIPAEEGFSDKDRLMLNPDVAHRYFSKETFTPRPPFEHFLKQKPENGYRIFMMGGSTTAGWPYPNHVMSSRILNQRLSDAFPDKTIEVINTGIAAVNSHTLLDFMDEILAQDPDAILIYAGHNEFYGALGAASTESLGGMHWVIRSYLALLDFKTVQWLRDRYHDLRSQWGSQKKSEADQGRHPTLMGQMIGERRIPYGGKIYQRAHAQFRENLRDILKRSKKAGVPVLISELVSNVRDQAPFVSIETEADERADLVFKRARRLEAEGDNALAREAYYRAKDLDGLRFRAAEALNAIIHETAEAFDIPVVPMKQYFEAASPKGLIGANIMLEHLHPKAEGYLLIADAFFEALRQHGFIRRPWKTGGLKPASVYAEAWPITDYDRALGFLRIVSLMDHWPFTPPSVSGDAFARFLPTTKAEELAYRTVKDEIDFIDAHVEMADYYQAEGHVEMAYREYQALIRSSPFDAERYIMAARHRFQNDDLEAALQLLQSALALKDSGVANKWSGVILLRSGRSKAALAHLERALHYLPDDTQLLYNLGDAYVLEGRKPQAKTMLSRLRALDVNAEEIEVLRTLIDTH